MTAINTNIKSLITQNALIKNNRALGTAMEQLSTGKRINSAADDAAGLAVSNRMSAQIQGLDQAVRNANDGISLIQTAEGSLNEVTSMLQRMRELSIQSSNDTYTPEDRGFLDLEFQQLKAEINRVANNTEWNGMGILNKSPTAGNGSGKFEFQVGANADQLISIQLQDFRTDPVVIAQPGTTNTVLSSGTANLSNTILAKKATATVAPVTAQPQNSVLTLSGAYAAGDTIKLDMVFGSTTNTFTYSVKASDIGANSAATLANISSAIVSQSGIDASLGVTLSTGSTADTIKFTGPPGVSFTPQVTTTITVGGKATAQTETAGTSSTRETNSIVLTGDYKKGDVITVNNGTNAINYTVKDADAGTANLGTLASNIAASAIGYLANTTVDVDVANKTIKFTATTFGSNTLNLTSSVQYASDKFDTTAAVIGTSGSPGVPSTPAVAQVDQLTVAGIFDTGDKVSITINGTAYDYTVSDSDTQAANLSEAIAKGLALTFLEASPAPAVSVARSGSSISFTGNADGTPFTSNVNVTRAGVTTTTDPVIGKPAGSLNMINETAILTRANANTAIESVDAAMSVINQSRAVMGAVMNRLTYAGENLINVAQNTTESRSRILDADFAKASSELARTQIISQAATSVLAQANTEQQSVLKLLQG